MPLTLSRNLSIRTRLLISMIGLTLFLTTALTYIAYKSTYAKIEKHLQQNVDISHSNIKTFLSLTTNHVDQLSMSILSNEGIQTAVAHVNRHPEPDESHLQHHYTVENELLEITLGRDEIRAIYILPYSDDVFSLAVDPTVSLDIIQEADLERIRAAAGAPVWLRTDARSMTIPMGRVFIDLATQKPAGILLIFFKEQYFSDILAGISSDNVGSPYLVSNDGFIISHSDKSLVGSQLHSQDIANILQMPGDSASRQTVGGQPSLVWSYIVPGYHWRLIRVIPIAYLEAPARDLQKRMLSIGLLCWAGAALLAIFISRSISKPVSRLVNSLHRFSDGESPQMVKWESNDEIGHVVAAYNEMLANLERTQSELVKNEREYRSIFQTAQEGIFRCSSDGVIQNANPATAVIFGYRDMAALIDSPLKLQDRLYVGPNPPEDFAHWLETAKSKFHEGLRVLTSDGRERYVALSMVEVKEADAQYYNGILQDITQRKQNERDRASLERQLQQSQKMESMGTLAGGIAHDFNNILASILGYSELLSLDGRLDKDGQRHLEQIQRAGLRARDLILQILNFSRPNTSGYHACDLNAAIRETNALLRASLPTSIAIESDLYDGELPVYGDATQIHQIMMNLMTNAAHAITDRRGTITVQTARLEIANAMDAPGAGPIAPGRYVSVAVTDTGVGIPASALSSIFDPFYTTKSKDKGTGLGLSVVHGLVTSHGGTIQVESTVGVGTTFRIVLPEHEVPAAEVDTDQPAAVETGQGSILYVDDERNLVDIGCRLLKRAGYAVTGVCRSSEALDAVARNPEAYDLLITDMNMPDLDGEQLAAAVRQVAPELPIIICTGYREQVPESRLRALRVSLCLQKPLTNDALVAAVHSCVRERPAP